MLYHSILVVIHHRYFMPLHQNKAFVVDKTKKIGDKKSDELLYF